MNVIFQEVLDKWLIRVYIIREVNKSIQKIAYSFPIGLSGRKRETMKRVNIFKTAAKEVAKGNLYLDKNGTFVSAPEQDIIKEYGKDIVSGEIEVTTSFEDYKTRYMETYIPVSSWLETLKQLGITEPEDE